MMKYAIVIEHAAANYSVYVPDLPGCVATGSTVEEARARIAEAVALHLEGMREDAEPIPPPTTICDYLAVA
jgi:predicted RNase H-like HicB family nuclease